MLLNEGTAKGLLEAKKECWLLKLSRDGFAKNTYCL